MPYPFAHPAAVLPLIGPMGRSAVPSALVIGSIVPDLWYFVPFATRDASHSLAGLFFFCLPVGLIAYLTFHLILKQPLVALLPPRLAPFAERRLPPHAWHAVLLCLLIGSVTHHAWDSFTHEEGFIVEAFPALQVQLFALGTYPFHVFQVVQHASTLFGTAFVCWWAWRAFRKLPSPSSHPATFPVTTKVAIIGGLIAISAAWALAEASLSAVSDVVGLRRELRSAGLAGAEALGVAVLAYCALMTWLRGRSRAPRSPAGR